MIEYAIYLPILIFILFVILAISHMGNVANVLSIAVSSARPAATRARLYRPTLADLNTYKATGAVSSRVQEMFTSTGHALNEYDAFIISTYGVAGMNLRSVSLENLYAMAFAIQVVRANFGENIVEVPSEGPGGLTCLPVVDPREAPGPYTPDSSFVGIECSYSPSLAVIGPAVNLLGWLFNANNAWFKNGTLRVSRKYRLPLDPP